MCYVLRYSFVRAPFRHTDVSVGFDFHSQGPDPEPAEDGGEEEAGHRRHSAASLDLRE